MKTQSDWHVAWIIWTITLFGQKGLGPNFIELKFSIFFQILGWVLKKLLYYSNYPYLVDGRDGGEEAK